jgi:hypothetical protein
MRSSALMAVFSSIEHGSMCGRSQVQPDHVSRLDLKGRIIGGKIALEPMRFDGGFVQMRPTVICEMSPDSAASLRENQRVEPRPAYV